MARNGKIARLPKEIRAELNKRLDDNEPGPNLLGWLNGKPEVTREQLDLALGQVQAKNERECIQLELRRKRMQHAIARAGGPPPEEQERQANATIEREDANEYDQI